MKNFGFIPSIINEKTVKYNAPKSLNLPKKYSYVPFLSPITNQGIHPYCVPHSISTWLNWKENIKTGSKFDNHISYADIYNSKQSFGEGMSYQEAFDYLKNHGVKTDKGIMKITEAGLVPNIQLLKQAILANGPCFGALPVYNSNIEHFWIKSNSILEGWHSISIVGWDEKGFIIRNSWGTTFGKGGYTTIPYTEASTFKEIWTILG